MNILVHIFGEFMLNENGTFKVKLYDFVAALLQGASGGADRM